MVGQCHGQRIHLGRERGVHPMVHPTTPVSTLELSYVDYPGCYLQNITCTYPGSKSAAATPSSGKQLSCSPAFPPLLHSQRGLAKKKIAFCKSANSLQSLANFSSTCDTASTEIVWKAGAMIEREYQAICWGLFFWIASCVLLQCADFRHDHYIESICFYMILWYSMQFYMNLYIIYSIRYH